MLSTVEIVATGTAGVETFVLLIDEAIVASFQIDGVEPQVFSYESMQEVSASDVRVAFTNDFYDPENNIDRNLIVDKILIDGVGFESEDPTTFSTGSYSDSGFVPGNLQTEYLHGNGYFQYFQPTTSTIEIVAAGSSGDEEFLVEVNGEVLGTFAVSTEFATYRISADVDVDPSVDVVRVAFTNDLFVPGQMDRDLFVDKVIVNGVAYESEADTTYSTGTWIGEGIPHEGFLNSNTLHVTGYFEYEAATDITIRTSGDEGSEQIRLQVDEEVVATFSLTTEFQEFTYQHVTKLDPSQIRVEFFDDVYDPGNSIDKNANVDWIQIDGQRFEAESERTYSNATYNSMGLEAGFGRGSALHTNGIFQFGFKPRDDDFSLPEDSVSVPLAVLNNDRIADAVGIVVVDGPQNGFVEILGGELLYTPNADFDGIDTLTYRLTRGSDEVASVVVNVRQSHQQPQSLINPDLPSELTPSGRTLVVERLVQLPFDDNGRPPRMNMMATYGDRVFVVTDGAFGGNSRIYELGGVDINSYREVFRVGMPVNDHPIRQAVFNLFAVPGDEDYGLLYIGHGDGSEQSAVAGDGQNGDALGKVLRVDPLQSDDAPFSVPASNPFVGLVDFPAAVYAVGFRNPHNLTFALDSSGQSHLLVTEIGRDNIEEVNVVVAGGNYGWADREGVFVHLNGEGQVNGVNANIANLPADEASSDYIYPVSILGHDGVPGDFFVGQAIAGGHVIQNGSSDLDGQFVFLEFATDGRAYHFDFLESLEQTTRLDPNNPDRDSPDDLTWLNPQELTILFDHDNDDSTTPLVRESLRDVLDDEPDFETILSAGKVRADLRLGQGPGGELYILNKRNGWVYVAANTLAESQDVDSDQDDDTDVSVV